jgi:hypothetical protein
MSSRSGAVHHLCDRPACRRTPGDLAAWALLALVLAAPACTYSQSRVVKTGRLSPTLAPMLFKEEGDLVLMTVGVSATRFRGTDPFIPLEVWVANKGISPYFRVSRESFYLMDTFGRRYGMAGVEEVRRLQPGVVQDRRMSMAEFNTFKFSAYRFVPSAFFPVMGAQILQDRIEIPRYGYISDMLYFPKPEGELNGGIFELHLVAKELPQEIFVVFEVPQE